MSLNEYACEVKGVFIKIFVSDGSQFLCAGVRRKIDGVPHHYTNLELHQDAGCRRRSFIFASGCAALTSGRTGVCSAPKKSTHLQLLFDRCLCCERLYLSFERSIGVINVEVGIAFLIFKIIVTLDFHGAVNIMPESADAVLRKAC